MQFKTSLINFLKGCLIGVAMIIPGVSGGTLAVLLKIYQDMINAVTNLRTKFMESVKYLLPIGLGVVVAFFAMYYPIKYALKYIPLQTTLLFFGLMLGSLPKIVLSAKENGFKRLNLVSLLIPFAVVIGICFIPNMGNVDIGVGMPVYQYFLLFVIGMLGSCALVVPGISGSMLLLILGYYAPLLNTISLLKVSPGHAIVVLGIFSLGIIVGFFTIAKLMKFLFEKFKGGTNWAIVGFVIASLPAILIVFDYSSIDVEWFTIVSSISIAIVATLLSYFLTQYMDNKIEKDSKEIPTEN